MDRDDPGEGYLLDNRQAEAGDRFAAMSELFDDWTFRQVRRLGIAPGWRCWEVGAGGPTVPAWLAEQVGPDGHVVATDIDLSWLAGGAGPAAPYEARRHDVAADPPPEGGPFDLVHARLVLVHLPRRDEALAAMAAALRPDGWLLIEDADPALQPLACPDERGPAERLANELRRGFRTLLARRGADLEYGRTLPRRLREAGLVDVAAEVFFPLTAPAAAPLELATVEQVRARLVAAGLATDADVETHLRNVAAGRLDLATAPLVSACGRRP